VEYANDIDTVKFQSGFPYEPNKRGTGVESKDCPDMFSDDYYARSGWNLNNIPQAQGSVLKHLQTPINGVNVPWLYLGMLFSSFCWHNEDNYLYSINYSHFGDTKQWYGVAGTDARSFEKVSKSFLMDAFKESPDLLHHMTTQISPSLLMRSGVPVYKSKQTAGTYLYYIYILSRYYYNNNYYSY
jgi:histone demethylase JARID1